MAPAPSLPRRRRVLVVDDEVRLCEMVKRMLDFRYEVTLALDARAAQSCLDTDPERYDVVLCDLMMPGMTGMDLFDAVSARHPALARKFVFMTGGAFTARATEFLARLEAPLLEKPFDLRSLTDALELRPRSSVDPA